MVAPTSMTSVSGQRTGPKAAKTSAATALHAVTSNVRAALMALMSRSPSRPQTAIIMMPTPPPKYPP